MSRDARARKARQYRNGLNQEFYECIRDVMNHPAVQEMKKYPHHCDTNCYQHCLNVAYYNYEICKVLGLDAKAAARAGMLHDLFLYDWRKHAARTGDHFHGLTHPRTAYKRASRYFKLSPLEKDMILKHMGPLTVIPPRHLESFIICMTDKYCGACEIADYYSDKIMPRRIHLPFGYHTMYRLASKLVPSKELRKLRRSMPSKSPEQSAQPAQRQPRAGRSEE